MFEGFEGGGRDLVRVLDETNGRMFIASRTRYHFYSMSGILSWSIKCISLEVGSVIASIDGQSEFGSLGALWDNKHGTVYFQLKLSDDSRYLAYEEHLELSILESNTYIFTYLWELQDVGTVEDDLFGPRITVNRGVKIRDPGYEADAPTFTKARFRSRCHVNSFVCEQNSHCCDNK